MNLLYRQRNKKSSDYRDHNYNKILSEYVCQMCDRYFQYKHGLDEHNKHHFGNKIYNCSKCTKTLSSKMDLYCHNVINHSWKTNYQCKLCKTYWITEDMYAEHMRTHAGEKRLYTCAECDKKYKTIGKFKVHRALHFERKVQGSCPVCLKTVVNSSILVTYKCSKDISDVSFSVLCEEANLKNKID